MEPLFRICRRADWEAAKALGTYRGADIDRRDGFIHLSTLGQVRETLLVHFTGVMDLVVLKIDPSFLEDSLRWEPSRGGALFPHLYASLPVSAVLSVTPVPDGESERRRFTL